MLLGLSRSLSKSVGSIGALERITNRLSLYHCYTLRYSKEMMKIFFFLFGLFFLGSAYSQQTSEAFTVRMFDQYVQVLSPQKIFSEQSVIIENKTLTRLIGRLQGPNGVEPKYISVNPGGSEVVSISTKGVEKLIFIPLSPAFQEVELKIGMPSYEIPPQR